MSIGGFWVSRLDGCFAAKSKTERRSGLVPLRRLREHAKGDEPTGASPFVFWIEESREALLARRLDRQRFFHDLQQGLGFRHATLNDLVANQ